MEQLQDLESVLSIFPHIDYAVAYGSGAVRQPGYSDAKRPMIDFIFAVRQPQQWHELNIARNRYHYSALALLGGSMVARIQENYGAQIYYNTLVKHGNMLIKYGVINLQHLCADLQEWTTLFVSGRLHKPVVVLQAHPEVEKCQRVNIAHAVSAALLLLPEEFHEIELYTTIASLSYAGDVRMGIGENPHKVQNIVRGSFDGFRELYAPALRDLSWAVSLNTSTTRGRQDFSDSAGTKLLSGLPAWVGSEITRKLARRGDQKAPSRELMARLVRRVLAARVAATSRVQLLKGILSAGLVKSVIYGAQKLGKRWTAAK